MEVLNKLIKRNYYVCSLKYALLFPFIPPIYVLHAKSQALSKTPTILYFHIFLFANP